MTGGIFPLYQRFVNPNHEPQQRLSAEELAEECGLKAEICAELNLEYILKYNRHTILLCSKEAECLF